MSALIRRVEVAGSFAAVVFKGDADRGDVIVKSVAGRDQARGYVTARSIEGERIFEDLRCRSIESTETAIDAYVERVRRYDPDLWVIEIEDRDLRHFLTETVNLPDQPD